MNKILFIITFLLAAMVIGACSINIDVDLAQGSGNVSTETRDVSNFDRLELSGIGDITLIQADRESLVIEAEDNVIKHITTEVRDGTLYIGFERKFVFPTKPVKFTLTMRDIHSLNTSGVSNLKSESLQTDRLDVNISGTGNIELEALDCTTLAVNVSGAGNFQAAGKVGDQKISLSGAGNFDGEDLQSSRAVVTISGLGRVSLWVTDDLNVTISGTGGVDYYGRPQVTQQISGLGKVNHKGDK